MTESRAVSAFCDDVLGTADAVEVARRIRDGEIDPSEAVEAAIARCKRANPLLNAVAVEVFEQARVEAQRPLAGPFAGVPSFIKDSDPVLGSPMRFGVWGRRS